MGAAFAVYLENGGGSLEEVAFDPHHQCRSVQMSGFFSSAAWTTYPCTFLGGFSEAPNGSEK